MKVNPELLKIVDDKHLQYLIDPTYVTVVSPFKRDEVSKSQTLVPTTYAYCLTIHLFNKPNSNERGDQDRKHAVSLQLFFMSLKRMDEVIAQIHEAHKAAALLQNS